MPFNQKLKENFNMSCGIRRILQFQEAIRYQEVKVVDSLGNDITMQCQYSWSSDGVCWTNWVDYNEYKRITSNYESDFYLRVLLFGSFDRISLGGIYTKCYNICLDATLAFLQDFCGDENLFQPYNNLDCALLLQQQLADSIICMLGLPIYYFRTSPKEETADYTFKEFTLHDVVAVKQLKLMIQDGVMPSSNPKIGDFDFDWQIDWETELSKTQFAKAFGDNAFPKAKDFLYIPMMKRMWQVNAAYDEKAEGLLWRSTTWKLSLVKYNESTNIDNGDFEGIIDNWLINTYDETFGELERAEQEREVGADPISSPVFAATNLYNIFNEDAVRKQYTKNDISIIDKFYCHNNNVISRNIYNPKNQNACIVYQNGICGESGTISFIIDIDKIISADKIILNFGPINLYIKSQKNNYILGIDNLKYELDKDVYIVIYRWNRDNFTTELNIYKQIYDKSIPIYKLRPESYHFDFENPVCELTEVYNNDFILNSPEMCKIFPWPLKMTNIKYYNRYLGKEEIIKESLKYVTKNEKCVINDLARPILSGHGYDIK